MTAVSNWLGKAGLERYARNFHGISEAGFLGLLMQDYAKYGVSSIEDKQKLYGLIKAVRREHDSSSDTLGLARAHLSPRPKAALLEDQAQHANGAAELLDLEEHDGDLISHAAPPMFQLSPMFETRSKGDSLPQQASDQEEPQKIRVVVRKRPLNKKEREKGEDDILEAHMSQACVIVNETKIKVDLTRYVENHQFNFDVALDETVTNEQIYHQTVQPLVHTLFKSGKATCFAYGQTGSGKTYTMSPLPVRSAADILKYITLPANKGIELYVSCFEIYGNKVFDLLNQRKRLNILEDGKRKVVVVGLKEYIVRNVDTLNQLIEEGNGQRSVGTTAANADSSRSHSIMQFALKRSGVVESSGSRLVGKLSFIDLAGSERGADTFDNNRQTRMEGAEINKSLLALKECIRALDSDARHVPFRGSKLTAVLRDSFIGEQARTVMIANISPNSMSVEHTLNTLRYADRVKELRKEKCDRAPGAVTPGDDYYVAVDRAHALMDNAEPPERKKPLAPPFSHQNHDQSQRPNPTAELNNHRDLNNSHAALDQDNIPDTPSDDCYTDEELICARDELMNSILEEEEELITAHRLQIEETMDIVRQEMNLLTEVDQPGSAIDKYVDRLEAILVQKGNGINLLLDKLDSFKNKLKEEEMMSRTVGKRHNGV